MVTTPTGLLYDDVVVGTGATPLLGQTVSIHYIASYPNGTVLQNTYLTGLPLNLTLGNSEVLAGLNEAIASMRVGGRRQVIILADLAVGSIPSGLPANTPLVFDIELCRSDCKANRRRGRRRRETRSLAIPAAERRMTAVTSDIPSRR